jgi:hypothetical protein
LPDLSVSASRGLEARRFSLFERLCILAYAGKQGVFDLQSFRYQLYTGKEEEAMQKTVSNRKTILIAAALVVLAGIFAGVYFASRPTAQKGAKTVTVSIVNEKKSSRTLTIQTDAGYLRGALEQEKLIAGEESAYGLFVKTVDGYTADDAAKEWWRFTKGGADLTTGVDVTPIADGDSFAITLMTGYN